MSFFDSIKPGNPKLLTKVSLVLVILFVGWLNYAVVFEHMQVKDTAWALTPPIIAITMALITKEVYSSLFLGMLTGAMLSMDFDPENGFNMLFVNGIMKVLADQWNVGILVFLVVLGTMVQMTNRQEARRHSALGPPTTSRDVWERSCQQCCWDASFLSMTTSTVSR